MTGRARTLHVLEPSKVGYQHIFVIDGYLRAINQLRKSSPGWSVLFRGSKATIKALSSDALDGVDARCVPVMDPGKRRLVRKCLLEVLVSIFSMLRMRRDDVLIITCLLSPSLFILQAVTALLPRRLVYIVLHGELEWLIKDSASKVGVMSVGYWARKWLTVKRLSNRLKFIVLDEFIRERLLAEHRDAFSESDIVALRPPVILRSPTGGMSTAVRSGGLRICFVGYRTRFKSFGHFLSCAREFPHWQFVAIGGGEEVDVVSGASKKLTSNEDYQDAIAACDIALLPYESGYSVSLSASALDAMSAGLHMVALERPFFSALGRALGPGVIAVHRNMSEVISYLRSLDSERIRLGRWSRCRSVETSEYGMSSVVQAFSRVLLEEWLNLPGKPGESFLCED